MAANKKPPVVGTNEPRDQNKSAFILAQPRNVPASEVVRLGRDRAMKFSAAYVHATRTRHRSAMKQRNDKGARRVLEASPVPPLPSFSSPYESELAGLVLRIGVERARQIVEEVADVRRRLDALG